MGGGRSEGANPCVQGLWSPISCYPRSAYAFAQNNNLPQFSQLAPAFPPLAANTDPCVSFM